MPLLDHFRQPLKDLVGWQTIHASWATRIADSLNERWLTQRFLASEHRHIGPRVEIDVAAIEHPSVSVAPTSGNGAIATMPRTWTVPKSTCTIPAIYPDSFEVLIHADGGGWNLVGAIELISPSNKDRPDERAAFAAKCASYLHEGVSVVIIDVVTERHANLHNELVNVLKKAEVARLPDDVNLYAAAYCPVVRDGEPEIDVWTERCEIGSPLPTMPLRLVHELFVPVEFEETYIETCRRRRIV